MTAAGNAATEPAEFHPGKDPEGQGNRDPVPIGALIRAFRSQPEKFINDTFPILPRQPDMTPVNVRLPGDPGNLLKATTPIIPAAIRQGRKASELSRLYPNHGAPGARVFFDMTQEEPT